MTSVRLEPKFRGLESNQRPPRSEPGVTTSSNCPGSIIHTRKFGEEDSNLHRLVQSQASLPLADPRECPAGVEPACPAWKPGASCRSAKGTRMHARRKERESNPQGSSLARFRAGCRRPFGLPFRHRSSSGGRNRTCVLPVNSRALVPARAPPESSRRASRGGRIRTGALLLPKQADCQAFPHPESSRSPTSAQRESNPHVRHGKAVGCRYIMGTHRRRRIVKEPRAPGGTRTHVAALRVRSLRRWTTSACITSGTGGARTLTDPVKSRAFCR